MASGTVGRLTGRLSGRRVLRRAREVADEVAAVESGFLALSDTALAALTGEYRARIAAGEDVFDLMIEAFAAVREAARRTLGLRHHDEQIMGGAAMAMGAIAQMQESEGKTLACVLPAYLAALEGTPVHVIAADDREAERAERWMAPVYRALGAGTGLIRPGDEPAARAAAYAADVVYGSADEIGYDLLRDGMAWTPDEIVQRGLGMGIVDDARYQFIESRHLELLIAGPPSEEQVEQRTAWAGVAGSLSRDAGDYSYDRSTHLVRLLRPGIDKLQDLLGVDDLRPVEDAVQLGLVAEALAARESGGEAPDPGRPVRLAKISVGGLLHEYGFLSGASADIDWASEALQREYGMVVAPIPSRRPERERGGWVIDMDRFERRTTAQVAVDVQRVEWAAERAAIMRGEAPVPLEGMIDGFLEWALHGLSKSCARDEVDAALALIGDTCPVSVTAEELMRTPRRAAVLSALRADIAKAFERRERDLGSETMRELELWVVLSVMDGEWHEHLARTHALLESLCLLGIAGADPDTPSFVRAFSEAVAESYDLMKELAARETLGYLFNLEVEAEAEDAGDEDDRDLDGRDEDGRDEVAEGA
ncbi:hypothetical protein ACQP1W_15850 [Spirillospora sp. CA-255316]